MDATEFRDWCIACGENGILRTMQAREKMDEMIPKLLAEGATPAGTPAASAAAN